MSFVAFVGAKFTEMYSDFYCAHPGGVFKQCVPITVQTNTFALAKKDKVRVERKQLLLVAAHALTVHKAQGSTMEYMNFEDEKAGNKYKDARLCGVFKQCVPM